MSRLQNGPWNKDRNLGSWASSVNRDIIAQLKGFRITSEICLSQKKEQNMGLLAPILPFTSSWCASPLPCCLCRCPFSMVCSGRAVRCEAVLLKVVCQQGTQVRDAWQRVWGAPPLLDVRCLLLRASAWNTEARYRAPPPTETNGKFPADVHRDSTSLIALADLCF